MTGHDPYKELTDELEIRLRRKVNHILEDKKYRVAAYEYSIESEGLDVFNDDQLQKFAGLTIEPEKVPEKLLLLVTLIEK